MKTTILLLGTSLALSLSLPACGISPQIYATQILSANDAAASNAVAMLRGLGHEGLRAATEAHQQLIAKHRDDDPQWKRLRAALDAIGGQRDCYASRLFWHTNFDAAKAEAKQTGKPILSLRLLGRLDEELSCANSRFFRTTLYANQEVSDYLRDHFVLHWKSVRPVPRITIDMGDGRQIERTITGNSIHYVLDANGEVVDALPGLYSPKAFLTRLQDAQLVALEAARNEGPFRARFLENFHAVRLSEINQSWSAQLSSALPANVAAVRTVMLANGAVQRPQPVAADALPLAVSKGGLERPMLRALLPVRDNLERSTTDETWAKIAAMQAEDAVLDSNSVALIRAKAPLAPEAMQLARSKRIVEDPMLKMIQNLQRSIAEDTVRNEYSFHSRIHAWLATPGAAREVEALNRRVYAELFLTPDSDPWLGLVPRNTFSALENGGLVQSARGPASGPR